MHVRIACQNPACRHFEISETFPLPCTGGFDACLDRCGRFPQALIAELVVFHPRHFDVNVDPVK